MLLAAVSWDGGGDGINWADQNNWSTNLLPGTNDDVTINIAANPTIIVTGGRTVSSLNSSEKLQINQLAQLKLINNSTISANVALDGYMEIHGTLTLNGVMSIGKADGSSFGTLVFGDGNAVPQQLTGNAEILFGASDENTIFNSTGGLGANGRLTLGANVYIHGQNGHLNNAFNTGVIRNLGTVIGDTEFGTIALGDGTGLIDVGGSFSATNAGQVWVKFATGILTSPTVTHVNSGMLFEGNTLSLAGVVSTNGGAMQITGITGSNLPQVTVDGGAITLAGQNLVNAQSFDMTGGYLTVTGMVNDIGDINLTGANIVSLTGTSLKNNLGLVVPEDASLNITGLTGNLGSITLGGDDSIFGAVGNNLVNNLGLDVPTGARLEIQGITGNLGSVTLGNAGTYVRLGGVNMVENLGINAPPGSTLILEGTHSIPVGHTVSAIDATLVITGSWSNNGTIDVMNSDLELGGYTSKVGKIVRSGGNVTLTATVDNGLNLNSNTGSFDSAGATFRNSTINLGGGAKLNITGTGSAAVTFDNMLFNGDLEVNGDALRVKNDLVFNGTLSAVGYAHIDFLGGGPNGQTLSGIATIEGQPYTENHIANKSSASGAAGTLTFAPTVYIHGGGLRIYAVEPGTSIRNRGFISCELQGREISLEGQSFINDGVIESSPGYINIDTPGLVNNGEMTVAVGGTNLGVNLGRFQCSFAMTLGGTFNAVLVNGYSPAAGTEFPVMDYPSATGDFSTFNANNNGGITLTKNIGANFFKLTAAMGGPTFAALAGAALSVTGTSGADTISLVDRSNLLKVTRNGTTMLFRSGETSSVNVAAGNGNDEIFARDGRVETIDAGGNTDTVHSDANDIVTNAETFANGLIAGLLFNDANSNGTKDAGEGALADWTVYLDANNNNALDAGESTRTTDANGVYLFDDLTAGTYIARHVVKSGYRRTSPVPPVNSYSQVIPNTNASSRTTDNFFGDTSNIMLSGTVYNDANGNGTRDAGEGAMQNVVVQIVSNNQVIAQRTTDVNGFWQVKGLSAGTGKAIVIPPAGKMISQPASGEYTGSLTSGTIANNLNFGLKPAAPPPAIVSPIASILGAFGDSIDPEDLYSSPNQ